MYSPAVKISQSRIPYAHLLIKITWALVNTSKRKGKKLNHRSSKAACQTWKICLNIQVHFHMKGFELNEDLLFGNKACSCCCCCWLLLKQKHKVSRKWIIIITADCGEARRLPSGDRYFQTYTSLSALNTWSWIASGDIHLIGSFLFFPEWYTFSTYTLRDNPKSATFTSLPSQTRTFLAARSRWTNPLSDRNSYEK